MISKQGQLHFHYTFLRFFAPIRTRNENAGKTHDLGRQSPRLQAPEQPPLAVLKLFRGQNRRTSTKEESLSKAKEIAEEKLRIDREGQPRTAYSLRHTYICLRLMEGADIYEIAKNCRTSVGMIEKYYASHIKTSLDAVAINVMRPKKRKSKEASLTDVA